VAAVPIASQSKQKKKTERIEKEIIRQNKEENTDKKKSKSSKVIM
jgi:hypothetical protein